MRTRIIECTNCSYKPEHCPEVAMFKIHIGRLGIFLGAKDMPPFEGKTGFVEVMGPGTFLKVLRQVEASTSTRELTEAERQAIYLGTRKSKPDKTTKPRW